MSHLILELVLWLALAFLIGCVLGWLLRRMLSTEARPAERLPEPAPPPVPARPAFKPEAAAPVVPAVAPVARVVAIEPVVVVDTVAEPPRPARPVGIAKPRGAKADNLQRISGIGPKNERVLHGLGIFHFDQIAAWTGDQVQWVDDHLKFNGRITREEWIRQAGLLAEGKDDEFARQYGSGGMLDRAGDQKSGTRTRRS